MTEPTKPKMTRKRALEIAMEVIKREMQNEYKRLPIANPTGTYGKISQVSEARYAELAAALTVIEHMARQQEMHL
jgi:hypothetical protein